MLIQPRTARAPTCREKFKALQSAAVFEAWRQIRRYQAQPDSPWRHSPTQGHLRGIDFYRPVQLVWVMGNAMRAYKKKHGRYPDICTPVHFSDKIFWFKFFGEIRPGLTGNKLGTRQLLPLDLQPHVKMARVVWHASHAVLPANDALAPGVYYFKVSHGSDMFRRIVYPLSAQERLELTALGESWLKSDFGLNDGEWWYHCFKPELLIEQDVCKDQSNSISWNFFVLNGEVAQITLFAKLSDGCSYCTWLDKDFEVLPHQSALPMVPNHELPPDRNDMRELARRIGEHFNAVRVDFLVAADGTPYLCELTFSPGNA